MEIQPPVFPDMDHTPQHVLASPSATNSPTHPHNPSYSARLSQWHHAYSALPEILCPPSAPPSPSFHERSAKLQFEIEQAVRAGRSITDFCKLRSSAFGYTTKKSAQLPLEDDDITIPWILPDTEEEWFDWERVREERRKNQKEKEREYAPPSTIQSQSTLEKVLNWKAGLEPTSPTPVSPKLLVANTTQPSLGFPVVKRSSALLNNNKLSSACKVREPVPESKAQPPTIIPGGIHNTNTVVRKPSKQIESDKTNVNDDTRSPSTIIQQASGAQSSLEHDRINFENQVVERPDHLSDFSGIPLSFPSHLPTSTPKDEVPQLGECQLMPDPPKIASKGPEGSGEELPAFLTQEVHTSTPKDKQILIMDKNTMDDVSYTTINHSARISEQIKTDLEVENETPPLMNIVEKQQTFTEQAIETLDYLPYTSAEDPRPLTPPPSSEVCVSTHLKTISAPRTPVREPEPLSRRYSVPSRNSQNRSTARSRPPTPESAINGGVNTVQDINNIFPPKTPERKALTTDLLATSRKSLPRPRPPSRKQLSQRTSSDADGLSENGDRGGEEYDPSPAKSERSYFSSPVSGSSSGSSHVPAFVIPDSPTSPFGLTQDPSRFAPLVASTQLGFTDGMKPLNDIAGSQGQRSSQSGSLARQSSGAFGMTYNSQFDVDSRINNLSHFLERDVDLNHWIRDMDTEDNDTDIVEQITFARSATSGST